MQHVDSATANGKVNRMRRAESPIIGFLVTVQSAETTVVVTDHIHRRINVPELKQGIEL